MTMNSQSAKIVLGLDEALRMIGSFPEGRRRPVDAPAEETRHFERFPRAVAELVGPTSDLYAPAGGDQKCTVTNL